MITVYFLSVTSLEDTTYATEVRTVNRMKVLENTQYMATLDGVVGAALSNDTKTKRGGVSFGTTAYVLRVSCWRQDHFATSVS